MKYEKIYFVRAIGRNRNNWHLSSILLPSLSTAKEKSRMAVCAGNLRQNMISTSMSIDAQNGFFHAPAGTTTGTYYNPLWSNWLLSQNYTDDSSVFLCPSRNTNSFGSGWNGYGARYSGNGTPKFTGSKGGDINTSGYSDETWMFGDSYTSGYAFHRMLKNHNGGYSQPWLIHIDRGNLAFFDGHVEILAKSKFRQYGFQGGWSNIKTSLSF